MLLFVLYMTEMSLRLGTIKAVADASNCTSSYFHGRARGYSPPLEHASCPS